MADNKKGVNPAAVGLAGIVIGAAAGAAAVALSDKENRKKLEKRACLRRHIQGWSNRTPGITQRKSETNPC